MRWNVRLAVVAATAALLLLPLPALAQSKVIADQGRPGNQGPWSVQGQGAAAGAVSLPYTPNRIGCASAGTTTRNVACDASGQLICVGPSGATANQVQGTAADGAAAVGNPVQTGGVDGAGNAQALAVDTSGRTVVVGAAATGAAVSGAPVYVGGINAAGNAQPVRVDSLGQVATNNTAFTSSVMTEVLVDTAAATATPAVPLVGRKSIEIQNVGPNPIWCNVNAAAVITKARRVGTNESWAFDCNDSACVTTCRASTALQASGAATIVSEWK
jgi:hypothetical protein